MEDFIADIYKRAELIEHLQEICLKMRGMLVEAAGDQWNEIIPKIQEQMQELSGTDPSLALEIIKYSEDVRDAWSDPPRFSAVIAGELLPRVREYIQYFNGIDITENNFTIRSSSSGFLTIYDNQKDIFLHDPYEPMWEAYVLADGLWRPEMEEFHLFGCGLGYLPYQIWRRSQKSTKIYLYEVSPEILDYAYHYGVLSWIPEEYIEIISDKQRGVIADRYQRESEGKNKGSYVTTWIGREYEENGEDGLSYERMNADACRWFDELWQINYRKNRKRRDLSVREIRERLSTKEWIVVAAGPSVDEQIEFLRDNAGKCRIVAVDVILPKLLEAKIYPDLVVIGDPKDQMERHIQGIEDHTKELLLLADRLSNWRYLEKWQGQVAMIAATNSIDRFGEADDREENWNIGGTVSSLAFEAAIQFGAKKIWLVGLDLGYPEGKKFASGTKHEGASEQGTGGYWIKSNDGGEVRTTRTFIFFQKTIERQIARNPDVEVINCSAKGAWIKGTKTISFSFEGRGGDI